MKVPKKVKYLKIVLKTINICLALSGLLAMAAGLSYLYTYTFSKYEFTILVSVKSFSTLLTLSGLVALILGSLGIGIITESNRLFSVIFTLFMIILQFMSMMTGIGGIMAEDKIKKMLESTIRQEFGRYMNNSVKIDWLQQEYQCCGLNSSRDWHESYGLEPWRLQNNISGDLFDVPDSCCIRVESTCGKRYMKENGFVYTRGCLEPYTISIRETFLSLSKLFLLFTLIIYTLIFFLMIVIKYFKNSYTLIKRV